MTNNINYQKDLSKFEVEDRLVALGFSTRQISLLIPFYSKIHILDDSGLMLLKEKLEAFGFVSEDKPSSTIEPISDEEIKELSAVCMPITDLDNDCPKQEAEQEKESPSTDFPQVIESTINTNLSQMTKDLARNIAIAVSKEINMHILTIKEEQDQRITALENQMANLKPRSSSVRKSTKKSRTGDHIMSIPVGPMAKMSSAPY